MGIEKLKKLVNYLNKLFMMLSTVLLIVVVAASALQVASRYIPGFKILSVEELARLAFIWMSFLGLSVSISMKGVNPSVTLIQGIIPEKFVWLHEVILQVVVIAFSGILLKYSVMKANAVANQVTPLLEVPMGLMYSAIVISTVGIIINSIVNIMIAVHERKDGKIAEEGC